MLSISQRGDTIIEVLLAITVFSLVSVGTMTIMNQGTNSAQRALEVTQVKEQIDSQAEALRAAQQAYATGNGGDWKTITQLTTDSLAVSGGKCPDYSGKTVFAMNGKTAELVQGSTVLKSENDVNAPPYSQILYTADQAGDDSVLINGADNSGVYGLWIEKTDAGGDPAAYDFTIHACWYSVGTNVPMELQTVVRLYDPAS